MSRSVSWQSSETDYPRRLLYDPDVCVINVHYVVPAN